METDLNGENSEIVTEGSSEAPQEIQQQQQQAQGSSGPNWIEGEEIINLKRRKRALKSRLTRLRHQIEKLCIIDSVEVTEVESKIEQLWQDLEETHEVLDNMSRYYVSAGQAEKHLASSEESDKIEEEFSKAVENAQAYIKAKYTALSSQNNVTKESLNITSSSDNQIPSHASNSSEINTSSNKDGENNPVNSSNTEIPQPSPVKINSRLKPLKVPSFDGDKTKFEDFWLLFESLVDCSDEPVNIKMARLRQSLSGEALTAVRGLGVSSLEYEEAKNILKTKFGGERRQLRAYMDQIESMPQIKPRDINEFERFADLVRVTVVKLKAENREGELGNGSLHSLLVKKLSDRHLEMYSRWLGENSREQSVISLSDWLKEEAKIRVEAMEMGHGIRNDVIDSRQNQERYRYKKSYMVQSEHGNNPPWLQRFRLCSCCGASDHKVWKCKVYRSADVDERWRIAKEKRLCFRCLGNDHQGKDCKRSQKCGIDGCHLSHHSLLHNPKRTEDMSKYGQQKNDKTSPETSREGAADGDPNVTMTTCSDELSEDHSLRTVPVWVKANGKKIKINAILDDASNETFLNEEVAGALGIQEPYEKVKVHVLNDSVETFESMPVAVQIESVDGQFRKEIRVRTCPRNVTGNYQVKDWSAYQSRWPHLSPCCFPKPARDGTVDMLIGVDNADLHLSMVDLPAEYGGPVARRGPLGWTCVGTISGGDSSKKRTHVIRTFLSRQPNVVVRNSCCDIDQNLKRFWEVESCGTETNDVDILTESEKKALDLVSESLLYQNGRYQVAVPWKDDKPKLPDNRSMATSRLHSTEKKLLQNEFVAKEYQITIEQYIQKGYLRRVPPDEKPPPEVWYLPHFPVIRMDKSTSKVRIVFDCSAKCEGISLNDVIHPGPKLQKNLFDVLVRFRRNPIALACDIKEMFLQIEVQEKDRSYFRILWRNLDVDQEPQEYEFNRVVFGKNAAPMEAQYVSQENARRHENKFPAASQTVLKSTYMDDSLDSVENDRQGIELYEQLKELWELAGMKARKWISNSPDVMAAIPTEDRAIEFTINDSQDPVTKTLGLSWNSVDDVLTIPKSSKPAEFEVTKRNVLSKIATIFDPLGFISPVVVRAKIMLQELWSRGYEWDEEVTDELAHQICDWFNRLSNVAEISVPRSLRELKPIVTSEVVTFVDASKEAYGAVAYLRHGYGDGSVTSRMIASKSKVAPLTPVTIPRLELMAAVLGLRLTQSIVKVLELNLREALFYSDSMDVLYWIRGKGRDFRSFVANRIGEVQMYTDPTQWQHVSSEENPADLCTRGVTPSQLAKNTLWWSGPEWLQKEKNDWPKMKSEAQPRRRLEEKPQSRGLSKPTEAARSHVSRNQDKDSAETREHEWRLSPTRFSDWTRLVHIYARVTRVVHNMQQRSADGAPSIELQPQEITDAQLAIIRDAQKEGFKEDYKALIAKRPLPTNSPLIKLNPRLDESGVIRSGSRLEFADYLPYDTKFPIILPRGQWVTKLIVKSYHEEANHIGGINFILGQLSKRFWIIAAREEILDWEKSCNECKRKKNKMAKQVMAPLPSVRLRFTFRPFDQTAVDFAGPFTTIQGRGKRRLKRWLCLFTCLSVRAVHLEMAWGLDTDTFLNAFTRFTSRRGVPKEVVSDCGTNFVGAVNELKELCSQLDKEKIQRVTVDKGVKWIFNPPAAPHFGGVHEIMVKSAKRAIYRALGNSEVTDEELITVFSGVESLINSRPLTYQTSDPRDDTPLTPNHFLHGQMGGDFAPETEMTVFSPKKRWRKVQDLISRVWRRWMNEYLPMLRARPRWNEIVEDIKTGDVVLVHQTDIPRGRWPLGRVLEVFPGKDGHTRVVKVQCGGKAYVRPIHKLVPLKVGQN